MNSLESLVRQAIQDGQMTPAMQAEMERLCTTGTPLSMAKYQALQMLMQALLTGEVIAVPQRQFINVMEELVLNYALNSIAMMEASGLQGLNLGDVVAYALNRLPPLYATTKEGARFQRDHADEQLHKQILIQVNEAIANSLIRPDFFPERQEIESRRNHFDDDAILTQVINLLKTYAPVLAEK